MPADHSPDGPVWNLAGLKFFSGTQEIPWQQDDVDMYAFNLDVPAGTISIDASLDFLISAPGPTIDFSASGAANLFVLMWNQVLLYPKGWPAADLTFRRHSRGSRGHNQAPPPGSIPLPALSILASAEKS